MAKIKPEKESKYKSKKVEIDGIKFDSKREANFYLYLKSFEKSGIILSINLQPEFILQESFKHVDSGNIKKISYIADFDVLYRDGIKIIYDIKGMPTPEALIKRKMFLKRYPNLRLEWITESKKYSATGWIDYFELQKIRRINKRKRSS